ncbi:ATP-binding protein [Amphritea sp. 1_MG-2023]|uniref:ATP-binding protein n=1 Tax=Amphritea sp. 1_MG-2023 TaxID=3062670 RepID=UPI0026E292D4|nr:ATP-binding protein [Amphritea sp. 1_MG-2023]MDO6563779.1 ATP-binding protein [Amphritea sp. 1_MG-2023]
MSPRAKDTVANNATTFDISDHTADMACRWLTAQCDDHAIDNQVAFQITVCLAEAINNILQHSGLDNNPIHLQCSLDSQQIIIDISHTAARYQTSSHTSIDLLKESGRGSEIMRLWTDQIHYRHLDGVNHLRLLRHYKR